MISCVGEVFSGPFSASETEATLYIVLRTIIQESESIKEALNSEYAENGKEGNISEYKLLFKSET